MAYNIYSNMSSDPSLQRRLQRIHAKTSMRGGKSVDSHGVPILRPGLGNQTQNAYYQTAMERGGRVDQFGKLKRNQLRSDLDHRGRMADIYAKENALKDSKKEMNLRLGLGAGKHCYRS